MMTPRGTDPPDVPVLPIRRQVFQIVSTDPWRLEPCRSDDPRPGGLLINVDALGRPVSPVYDEWPHTTVVGWRLGNPFGVQLTSVDPGEVLAFWASEVERRRKDGAARSRGRDS